MATRDQQNDRSQQQENKTCPGEIRALLADSLAGLRAMRRENFALHDRKLPPEKDTSSP